MTRLAVIVALAASGALLAGCAPAVDLPEPMSSAEAQKQMDEQNLGWWTAMFPDDPMPVVEPIEYISADDAGVQSYECVKDLDIEGLTVESDGSWSFSGTPEESDRLNRAQFICAMQYPYDLSDPGDIGMLSEAEKAWLWNYDQKRLVPCLRMLGYPVVGRTGEYVVGGNDYWMPYYDLPPQTEQQWALIDARCPPPPVGPLWRPITG